MVESPAQSGRMRTLTHPGPISGVRVNMTAATRSHRHWSNEGGHVTPESSDSCGVMSGLHAQRSPIVVDSSPGCSSGSPEVVAGLL